MALLVSLLTIKKRSIIIREMKKFRALTNISAVMRTKPLKIDLRPASGKLKNTTTIN